MSELIVTVGLPFSGKSTYVRSLTGPDVFVIERDSLLESLYADSELIERLRGEALLIDQPISKAFETKERNAFNDLLTREYVRRVAELVLSSKTDTIVVDGTHLQALSRSFVRLFPDRRRIAMVFETPSEECVRRLQAEAVRQGLRASITAEMIERLYQAQELPTNEEGFDEVRFIPWQKSP